MISPAEPIRLPGPPDGWTRHHEVMLECLALSEARRELADAALAALGEINRLRLLAAAGAVAADAWIGLEPHERTDLVYLGLYVELDRLAEAHGLGDDDPDSDAECAS